MKPSALYLSPDATPIQGGFSLTHTVVPGAGVQVSREAAHAWKGLARVDITFWGAGAQTSLRRKEEAAKAKDQP